MQISAENIAEAVNIANQLRSAFGKDLINDLPAASPGSPEKCVLAKAFNFNCEINGYNNFGNVEKAGKWYAQFDVDDLEQAEKLAEILNTKVYDYSLIYSGVVKRVDLPDSIKQIATAFDEYKLDSKYYEK